MESFLWSFLKIILALFLVVLNGFFVAAEFALVKVRKTRLAELAEHGSRRAETALQVTSHLDAYLSACQLGITLASLGLGWLGEPAIATLVDSLFANITNWTPVYTHSISIVIAFIIITFLHIVIGELVPKSLAIAKAEDTALRTAGPLKTFYRICYPVIWTLNGLAISLLKIWHIAPSNEADLSHTEEELRMLVEASQKHGHLDKMEGKLLDNVFEFSDRIVNEVMVPRQDMKCLFIQDSYEEMVETMKIDGHTRYPICDDDKDNILGMIHIRDIFLADKDNFDYKKIVREILIVPEGMPISHLVQRMRSARTHIAVVIDEFGGTAGLVTIEDLMEELVGEIYDEFDDKEEPMIVKVNDNEFVFNGRLLLEDVSDLLEEEIEDENVSTIGGFIFNRLGRRPVTGDEVNFGGYVFSVLEVNGLRITKVKSLKKNTVQ